VPLTVPALAFGLTVRLCDALTGLLHPVFTVYIIVTVPDEIAVTTPVETSTVAIALLLLVHSPPGFPELEYVADEPMHSGEAPLTVPADAFGLIVSDRDALTGLLHPAETVYVIITVPALIAVTTPVEAFTVAIAVLLELQAPPALPLLEYVAVDPMQSGEVPLTVPADAFGLTVRDCCAVTGELQPLDTV
jgi:hypothetical protein